MTVDSNLIDFVAQGAQTDPSHIKITKLFGQASARQYFRAALGQAHDATNVDTSARRHVDTFVIMQLPRGFSSPAEEVTNISKDAPKELPFINIQKYLTSLGINVPKIYALDAEKGLLLLEDLGNTLFEDLVKKADGNFFLMYYRKAIDLLVEIQMKTLTSPPLDARGGTRGSYVWAHRFFDADLLNWEWNHFLEYGIEDRLDIKVNETDRQTFKKSTQKLTDLITKMPQGFVLRDFQSRNIMFHNFDFYLIDFQDALTGPMLYDLVALLRDSYVAVGPEELESLLAYYASILPKEHPYHQTDRSDPTDQSDQLKKDFHTLTLHRKLKDTGRFQYIHTVKKNSKFLAHVPQSLEYVRHAFECLGQMGYRQEELQKMIGKYLVELS